MRRVEVGATLAFGAAATFGAAAAAAAAAFGAAVVACGSASVVDMLLKRKRAADAVNRSIDSEARENNERAMERERLVTGLLNRKYYA